MRFSHVVLLVLLNAAIGLSAEPLTIQNVVAPSANRADEPLAKKFSIDRAGRFLDAASLHWQKSRKCMTCHTNYAYLYARPSIDGDASAHAAVRNFAEQLVSERWEKQGPRWDAEVVATAAALAFNDSATSGKLQDVTKKALDRMWTVQRGDGGWNWLKCGWPPLESDDHYGVTLAAIAVAVAPDGYAKTDVAKSGIKRIRDYFANHPPTTLHHRAMLLWANSYWSNLNLNLITAEQKAAWMAELRTSQKADGGWALATLGDWKRRSGQGQDTKTSDGYATGFAVYVLRRSGTPANSPEIQKGLRWLRSHQRESGRWFTRSLTSDAKHYISHAGTAMAVMALAE